MSRPARLLPGLVIALAPALGPAQSLPESGLRTLVSDGSEREYLLHVPSRYADEPVPLVLNFHGSGGVPANQVATSGFDALADEHGFAVAYPAGAFENSVSVRSWNANVDPGVDDVRFARDLIADVAAVMEIDPDRIYATGFSGGARMTSRLACALDDLLAAAAPVAGLQYPDGCEPAHAVPIIAFHGRADRVNQYEVSADSRPYWRMGVETAAARWREAYACGAEAAVETVAAGVERRLWTGCDDGAEIRLYVSESDGHVWPAGASETIWAFFADHSR